TLGNVSAPGNEIVFDLSAYGYSAVDIHAAAAWFKDFDKTIKIITDYGATSVKTKTLWNNSGKQILITVRNNKIEHKNI
ncbi:MAG: hypothetical protein FWG06_03280, partial [Clostridiales bacterium]|nr:hypothetical protein [Clostridiales bacterium]